MKHHQQQDSISIILTPNKDFVVRSRYGNIATAMVKFDGDPAADGGDGNVLHIHVAEAAEPRLRDLTH